MGIIREHDVELVTPRALLRPLRDQDFPTLLGWNQDLEVLSFSDDTETPYTLQQIQGIYGGVSQNAYCFMIEVDAAPIGECWLQRMNLQRILSVHPEENCRRIDIMIGEKHLWGRGYGTEALNALVEFGFGRERADLIFGCDVSLRNPRSIAAFKRAGFGEHGRTSSGVDLVITREGWEEAQRAHRQHGGAPASSSAVRST